MLFAVLLLLNSGVQPLVHGSGHITSSFARWPSNPAAAVNDSGMYSEPLVEIPYDRYFEHAIPEFKTFVDAATTINRATKNCIRFVPTYPSTANKLRMTAIDPVTGALSPVCRGPLGYLGGIQHLVLVGTFSNPGAGRAGCLQDQRDVTRLLLNALGVVSEFQRPDRDVPNSPLRFLANYDEKLLHAVRADGMFHKKAAAETVAVYPDTFDILSVTMVHPGRYAKSASDAVCQLAPSGKTVGTVTKLSKGDCEVLSYMYQCNITCESTDYGAVYGVPGFDTEVISQSHFCWPNTTGFVSEAAAVGEIQANYTAWPNMTVYYEFTPSIDVLATPVNGTPNSAQLTLTRPIRTGFQALARLIARDDNKLLAADDNTININCWLQFRLTPSADGVSEQFCGVPVKIGTTVPDLPNPFVNRECRRTGIYNVEVPCASETGPIPTSFDIISIDSVCDPDGTESEFVTQTLVATALDLNPDTFTFRLIFIDPNATSPIEFVFKAHVSCVTE
ncbi:uncharacterized protein LOC129596832 isoform X2 [Paramacrobiotus metropolitanus]|uniref:uncharacterized protein LOC129596832 isoform X2 n=1 Tax=Paramacrobiotus metropolitanus TaxID=2943436 RepID=UPI0024463E39|nr:uncharacterized protein LOC129596832 isoform X2 [Paramacrobiotus metropolitanus]